MSHHPPAAPAPAEGALLAPYAARWVLAARPAGLHIWTAERRSADGRSIHYVVATSPRELAGRLAAIEAGP
jgi:hypothetical protein